MGYISVDNPNLGNLAHTLAPEPVEYCHKIGTSVSMELVLSFGG